MKSSKALLWWSLDVKCPHCGQEYDLSVDDADNRFSHAIFNNDWNDLRGEEVTCPNCEEDFQIEEVEY
ncbi:MAG: hypothetical protein RBR45_15565 [Pseudomonas sp.]|nr:hypothetical protein [Pseudomonas sp.]